ncbi:MAG: hypothetical protein MZV49_22975 [Rhodopseudomonas palustris]|nr:hypothetical protein [Rhodopseudomonas palustris]
MAALRGCLGCRAVRENGRAARLLRCTFLACGDLRITNRRHRQEYRQ